MTDAGKKNSTLRRIVSENTRELGLLMIIVVLSIFVNIRSGGSFLLLSNISDLLTETAVLIILTMGMMMVIITGGIDLSIGAIMALGAMTATLTLKNNMTMSPILVVMISMLVGLGAGIINGFLVSRLKILPIIATLGMMNVFRGSTYLISDGSWVLQQDMSKGFMEIATGTFLGINNLIIISFVTFGIVFFFLNYIRKGRQIYAVGSNKESAEVSGINNRNVLMLAYAIMGLLAGLAGVLYVCKYAAAQGETASGYEMNVIAACVLGGVSVSGGRGKVHGVLLGALLFGILNNALPLINVSPFWQDGIRGFVILASILGNTLVSRRVAQKALERRVIL